MFLLISYNNMFGQNVAKITEFYQFLLKFDGFFRNFARMQFTPGTHGQPPADSPWPSAYGRPRLAHAAPLGPSKPAATKE